MAQEKAKAPRLPLLAPSLSTSTPPIHLNFSPLQQMYLRPPPHHAPNRPGPPPQMQSLKFLGATVLMAVVVKMRRRAGEGLPQTLLPPPPSPSLTRPFWPPKSLARALERVCTLPSPANSVQPWSCGMVTNSLALATEFPPVRMPSHRRRWSGRLSRTFNILHLLSPTPPSSVVSRICRKNWNWITTCPNSNCLWRTANLALLPRSQGLIMVTRTTVTETALPSQE